MYIIAYAGISIYINSMMDRRTSKHSAKGRRWIYWNILTFEFPRYSIVVSAGRSLECPLKLPQTPLLRPVVDLLGNKSVDKSVGKQTVEH